MPTCFSFLFSDLLVLFLLLLIASLSSPQPLCHQDESLALMQFRDSFIIKYTSCPARTTSWRVEAEHGRSNCCSWDGVECDPHTGHVIGLDLSASCLYGSINSNSSLFRLSHLRSLNLAYNDLNYSKIPSTIGNLSRLTYLNLTMSKVSGEMPFEVSYLSKLSSLDLSFNYDLLIGSLTRLVQNLTCLEEILLLGVNISSKVPESLANLSSLRTLKLSDCGLYGEFPIRIFQLPQLRVLRIGYNEDLTGHLPEFHSSIVLQTLSLSETSFFAKLPASIGNLNSLELLDIAHCNFSGSIPNSLWNLTQLIDLDLSGNSFDDLSCLTKANSNHTFPRLQYLYLSSLNLTKFPNSLRNQNKLVFLDLSKNNIQGLFPISQISLSIQDLYISNNFLTGFENSRDVLPWPNLRLLDLQNNRLQGSFPISQIPPSIQELFLSNNFLTGFENSRDVLPWPNLRLLDLQNNRLQGSFPISQIPPSIQELFLSNNFLTGFENSRDVLPWPNLQLLHLQNNRLQGSFPISQIPPSIQYLHLSNNFFTGFENSRDVLPWPNLRLLDLQNNRLQGSFPISQIPPSIQELFLSNNFLTGFENSRDVLPWPNLRLLDLQNNRLQGSFPISQIPPSIQELFLSNNFLTSFENSRDDLPWPNLYVFDLQNNSLQGSLPIPPPYVQSYRVNKNGFTGDISPLFCNLSSLVELDLSYNNLSSMLHPCFSNLSQSLTSLQLQSNNVGGTIPDAWAKGCNLRLLDLSHNKLQGQFPRSLANCKELEYLDVGYNKIHDTFPLWFETLPELKISILPWPNLYLFNLENNSLQGSLPIPPPLVLIYQVNKNAFTGEISPLFCNLSSLAELDLSYNNLSGMLHPCFCNLSQSLIALELRSNNISGTIPDAWAKGCNLRILDLSHNKLQGRFSRSLANCKELGYLDVGYNKIHDSFPLWLGTLPELKIFILRSNGFYGAIRNIQINCTFSNLHILYLSHNNFFGDFPAECFQQWNAMKLFGAKKLQYMRDQYSGFFYSITLTTKGIELEYQKIQDELIVIDLSCNKFEGEIPEVVGNLKGLHILNFSNNALSGHIPLSLANLTYLESLDLSQNKLFGEIPPQLAQLTFLEIFKVFSNCLTGPIPHGSQFERFPNSSFDGNLGLCGWPLSKACGDSLPKPPTLMFEGNQGLVSSFEFGWKVVAIGYGCGFVIGIVIGQWVIARKQVWFVNTFRIKK